MSGSFALRTCAACERRVMPTAAGCCPRCDARLVDTGSPSTVKVRLGPETPQPHVCLRCGAPAHRLARVRLSGPRPQGPVSEEGARVVPAWGAFGQIGAFLAWLGGLPGALSGRPAMRIRVRQCADCASAGPPHGFSPDYDLRQVSFEVHPRFGEALARELGDARSVSPS